MQNKKILFVDDEENILKSFRKDFEYEGYLVTTALSGEKALEHLQQEHFNVVITDLAMPGIDGLEVLKKAKKLQPDTILIILTGYGDLSSAIEALRLGADDYLLKPCDIDELFLRVQRCLEKQEALQKIRLYENILPICMYCKSIRDDSGAEETGEARWMSVEEYISSKSGTDFSHGICPNCMEKFHNKFIK